jgi:hypothetical protein
VTDEESKTQDATNDATPDEAPGEGKHNLKQDVREAVAKAVGIAVEAGSMLSGHSGEMVSAEGKVAEADTEKFIDKVDGEG